MFSIGPAVISNYRCQKKTQNNIIIKNRRLCRSLFFGGVFVCGNFWFLHPKLKWFKTIRPCCHSMILETCRFLILLCKTIENWFFVFLTKHAENDQKISLSMEKSSFGNDTFQNHWPQWDSRIAEIMKIMNPALILKTWFCNSPFKTVL